MPVTKKKGAPVTKDQLNNYQIISMPLVRRTSDIGLWRKALRNADHGRMALLYELFEDLLIDGVLFEAVQKRVDAIKNSDLIFRGADGEPVTDIIDIIETEAFELLLDEIMQRRFWGRAGVEFDFTSGFQVRVIPRRHISLETQSILVYEHDLSGIPYVDDPFVLILGESKDFGLLNKTAPLVIYKRGGFGDWSQFVELFGMPNRIGKYNAYDPESRTALVKAMQEAGSAPYIVIPDTASVETVNNTGTQNSATYNDFRKACNEEMLITILGQTMTSTQGDKGARSLGEVHKEVEDAKHKSDMRYVVRILNEKVVPILEARGYPVRGGKFVFPKAGADITVDEVVNLSSIIDIPAKYLYDKYGIPMPKGGEDIATAVETWHAASPNAASPNTPQAGQNLNEKKLSDNDLLFFV